MKEGTGQTFQDSKCSAAGQVHREMAELPKPFLSVMSLLVLVNRLVDRTKGLYMKYNVCKYLKDLIILPTL